MTTTPVSGTPVTGLSINPLTGIVTGSLPVAATYNVVITASDGHGGSAAQSYQLVVSSVAQRPSFTSLPEFLAVTGEPYTYQAVVVDPNNQPITYGLSGTVPSGMSIDPNTGLLTWTSATGSSQKITVTGTSDGIVAAQTFTITVVADNGPNFESLSIATQVTAGDMYSADFPAVDIFGNTPSYSVLLDGQPAPAGLSIDPSGDLTWDSATQDGSANGIQHVDIVITDAYGKTTDFGYNLTVVPHLPPTVTLISTTTQLYLNQTLLFHVAYISDGISSINVTANGVPVAIDPQGNASITPTAPGPLVIIASATDTSGLTGSDTEVINVLDSEVTKPPSVTFNSPLSGDTLIAPTNISAEVQGQGNFTWTMDYAPIGSHQFTTLGTGSGDQNNPSIISQLFDTTSIPDGAYTLRITATNDGGFITQASETLNVNGASSSATSTCRSTTSPSPATASPSPSRAHTTPSPPTRRPILDMAGP